MESKRSRSSVRYLLSLFLLFTITTNSLGHVAAFNLSGVRGITPSPGQEGSKIVLDISVEDLDDCYMHWRGFMQACSSGDYPLSVGENIQEAVLHLEFDFEAGRVTGELQGGGRNDKYQASYVEEYSFQGTLSGALEKVHQSSYRWYWDAKADVELDLRFYKKYKCKDTSTAEEWWIEDEKTAHVTAKFTASTNSDTGRLSYFEIWWRDEGGINGAVRDFRVYSSGKDEGPLSVQFPEPINLKASISGLEEINKATQQATFHLETSGSDVDMIKTIAWHFHYTDEYGDLQWFEGIAKNDVSPLVIERAMLDKWLDHVDSHGLTVDGVKSLEITVFAEFLASEERELIEHVGFNFTYSTETSSRYRVEGCNLPMKYMEIIYRNGPEVETLTTDGQGDYFLNLEKLREGASYELELCFKYVRGGRNYFTINAPAPDGRSETLRVRITVKDEKITSLKVLGSNNYQQTIETSLQPIQAIKLDELLSGCGWDSFVLIYQHITESLEFYMDELGEEIEYRLPLSVVINVPNGPKERPNVRYVSSDGRNEIWIEARNSMKESELRPKNREYHEFSHFAMLSIYGRLPQMAGGEVEEVNHDGYINPSTADSYIEGFAVFMSMIMGERYALRWSIPEAPWECSTFGNLELNYRSWEISGLAEEYAIAGILWDLYDGEKQIEFAKTQLVNIYREVTSGTDGQELVNSAYDGDGSGNVEKFEMGWATAYCELDEDSVPESLRHLRQLPTLDDVVTYVHHSPILRDASRNDFITYWRELKAQDPEKLADEMFQAVGKTEGSLTDEELERAYEVALKLYFDELKQNQAVIRALESLGEAASAKIEEVKVDPAETIEELRDDDKVSIPFEEIWSILRAPHDNFLQVYNDLIGRYPEKRADIDEIFVSHGFWSDTDAGNGRWDEDEPYRDLNDNGEYDEGDYFIDYPTGGFQYNGSEKIGSASNYQRPDRHSSAHIPGQFVKVDNDVPFYRVTAFFYEKSFSYGLLPSCISVTRVMNNDGYVYLPIPPESQDAVIEVLPMGVPCNEPLIFTAHEYHSEYTTILENGYFKEHDFAIQGEAPEPPTSPVTTSAETEPEPESETESTNEPQDTPAGGIPGFPIESVVLGSILAFIATWLKKNRG